jgi:hypothetical protein
MNAADFSALVRDLRAAGIDFEPEIDRLPFLVRQRAALMIALGQLCIRLDAPRDWAEFVTLCNLRKRCHPALRWIEAMGKRSIWGTKYGWFRGCS